MDETSSQQQFHGSCHCSNNKTTLNWPDSTATIPVRACGCDLCTKHGAVWTSHPNGSFELQITDQVKAAQYQFGTKTAEFHLCLNCGVIPAATCTMEGTQYAVLNVNTFDDVDPSLFDSSPTDFEGESIKNRLARRHRNWTPQAAG